MERSETGNYRNRKRVCVAFLIIGHCRLCGVFINLYGERRFAICRSLLSFAVVQIVGLCCGTPFQRTATIQTAVEFHRIVQLPQEMNTLFC